VTTEGPLAGVRILDLTRLLPGPFCTMLLGDLGADVIKVEEPTGDPARQYPLFELVNRNKRSITLDLKHAEDRDVLLRLVETADAVVESFRPGVMNRLGVGYAVLKERNRRIVYASLSGFGQSGPYRDRPGHDLNYLALAGVLGYNVVPGSAEPAMPAVQVADLGAGSLAALAIVAALFSARQSQQGQMVDVSLFASAVAWLPTLLASGVKSRPGEPMLSGGFAQYGVYATADGRHVTLGALEPKFLSNFLDAVGRPDLLAFARDRDRLRSELEHLFAGRTLAEWVALLDNVDTCFAPVNTLEEAIADPHVRALDLLGEAHVAPPFVLSETPAAIRRPSPALGEHNAEVRAELT
jgi:alpha-methylacyl-CoA racemase